MRYSGREDGTTRILELWDQTQNRIYTEGEINRALEEGSREAARNIVPSVDASGHGTAVAGIAAGDGRGAAVGQTADGGGRSTAFSDSAASGMYRGIACESDLLVVKLGTVRPEGFPRTTELMRAVRTTRFPFAQSVFFLWSSTSALEIIYGSCQDQSVGNLSG